ncbi:MAG: ATP-binding cassette domain-containing protein [Magnetococcales bacterium]|nr:ATP-binding cassette domain-containing protein [Magnetococcales bacterium]MBF0156307.1 ATP-binding cassette domain-containing protein [Magnetococcales bacterium]
MMGVSTQEGLSGAVLTWSRFLTPDEPISGLLAALGERTDFGACIVPLLTALGFRGDWRHVAEAIPHFVETLDLTGFRNLMANMGYVSRRQRLSLERLDPQLLPCLFLPERNGGAMVVLERRREGVVAFDGMASRVIGLPNRKTPGIAYCFEALDLEAVNSFQMRVGWFRMAVDRFRGAGILLVMLTTMLMLFQSAATFFLMGVYDRVIGTRSPSTLDALLVGVCAIMIFEWGVRKMRSQLLGYVGSRLDGMIGQAIVGRIFSLPPSLIEQAPVGTQVARIREFDAVRDFFTGPLVLLLLDFPVSLLILFIIGALAGPLVLVPIAGMVLFLCVWLLTRPILARLESDTRLALGKRREFEVETLSRMRTLKFSGVEENWLARYAPLSAEAAIGGFRTALFGAGLQNVMQWIAMVSGAMTVALGVQLVLDGRLTTGGLVVTMILIWRVFAPLQGVVGAMGRIKGIMSSIGQIDKLMSLVPEREVIAPAEKFRSLVGAVSLDRLLFRYPSQGEPAISGVVLETRVGEVIAITGPNGSGKSTLLKLVAGLYDLQGGAIRFDGVDIRQLDRVSLRHAIVYIPERPELFHGTIAQNLRLAHATATDADIVRALGTMGIWDQIQALPEGIDTRLGDHRSGQLPSTLVRKLSLARAFLRPGAIMIFDEPATGMDPEGDLAFVQAIQSLRGRATIFFSTHQRRHLELADRVLVLDRGAPKLFGTPNRVLAQLGESWS